jgi:hypothetical protein
MQTIKAWIELHKKEALFCGIIMLTATLSFGLGYFTNREFNHAPIIIEQCSHNE